MDKNAYIDDMRLIVGMIREGIHNNVHHLQEYESFITKIVNYTVLFYDSERIYLFY